MEVKGFCLFKDFNLVEPGESDVQGTSGVSEEFAFLIYFLSMYKYFSMCCLSCFVKRSKFLEKSHN